MLANLRANGQPTPHPSYWFSETFSGESGNRTWLVVSRHQIDFFTACLQILQSQPLSSKETQEKDIGESWRRSSDGGALAPLCNGTSHISGVGLSEHKAHNWIISLASPKPRPGNFSPGNISLPKEILPSTQRPGLTTTSGKMKAAQKLSSCQVMPLLKIFLNICPTDLPFQYQDQNVCIDANILVLILILKWIKVDVPPEPKEDIFRHFQSWYPCFFNRKCDITFINPYVAPFIVSS